MGRRFVRQDQNWYLAGMREVRRHARVQAAGDEEQRKLFPASS
jgi:hypothetical protein